MIPRAPTANRTLRHGEFFGRPERVISAGGFTVAFTRADPHLIVERHTHENAHFIFLVSGAYVTTAHGAPPLCVSPTLIYNPPGTTHADRFRPTDGRCDGHFLSISVGREIGEACTHHVSLAQDATCLADPAAVASAARVVGQLRDVEADTPLIVEGICLDLTSRAALRHHDSRWQPPWLRLVRELLRDDRSSDLSVHDIAHACGVHPVYLARAFRRHFHCSPGEYRLERAAALLTATCAPLSAVALESGFTDQSHMCRVFQRALAMPPGEYRRRHRA